MTLELLLVKKKILPLCIFLTAIFLQQINIDFNPLVRQNKSAFYLSFKNKISILEWNVRLPTQRDILKKSVEITVTGEMYHSFYIFFFQYEIYIYISYFHFYFSHFCCIH